MLNGSCPLPRVADDTFICYKPDEYGLSLSSICTPVAQNTVMHKFGECLLNAAACLPSHLIGPLPIMPLWETAGYIFGKEEGNQTQMLQRYTSSWDADLGEHGFAVLGHHAALVTIEGHKVAVECLLGVLKHIV